MQSKYNKAKNSGWRNESVRHSLASRGISTGRKSGKYYCPSCANITFHNKIGVCENTPSFAKQNIDDERLEFLLRGGYTIPDVAIFFNVSEKEAQEAVDDFRNRTHFAKPSTQSQISSILYSPKKDAVDRELLTIEIPRSKAKKLGFLKAYTKFNTQGVWKGVSDDNVQIEIEFKDAKDEKYGIELMKLFNRLNNEMIKEDVLYVRTEPIEESTLSYAKSYKSQFDVSKDFDKKRKKFPSGVFLGIKYGAILPSYAIIRAKQLIKQANSR
jgi:hypothetical protein